MRLKASRRGAGTDSKRPQRSIYGKRHEPARFFRAPGALASAASLWLREKKTKEERRNLIVMDRHALATRSLIDAARRNALKSHFLARAQ